MSPKQHQTDHNGNRPYSHTSTEVFTLPQPVAAANCCSPLGPGKRPPRFVAHSAVLNDHRLKPGPVRLYCVLDDYAGERGECYPYQATLAKQLGVAARTIRRWEAELVKAGHMAARRTARGNRYTLAWVVLDRDRTPVSVPRSDTYVRSDRTSVAGGYVDIRKNPTI